MKKIAWIIGKMGTGKTTLIENYTRTVPNSHSLLVGQICRKRFGSGSMAKSSNPGAPEETESFVRQLVIDRLEEMEDGEILFVDGMPRKPSQVRWIVENFIKSDIESEFVYVFCEELVRQHRARNRDDKNAEDMELQVARNQTETVSYLRVLEELGILGVQVAYCDNTKDTETYQSQSNASFTPEFVDKLESYRLHFRDTQEGRGIESVKRHSLDLREMWDKHMILSQEALKHLNINPKYDLFEPASLVDSMDVLSPSVDWARRFLRKAIEELRELEELLPETWWSKDPADLRGARVELIDMWHFILSAAQALGMDADLFVSTYYGKRTVNLQRWKKGYRKRDKDKPRDDMHLGSVEGLQSGAI